MVSRLTETLLETSVDLAGAVLEAIYVHFVCVLSVISVLVARCTWFLATNSVYFKIRTSKHGKITRFRSFLSSRNISWDRLCHGVPNQKCTCNGFSVDSTAVREFEILCDSYGAYLLYLQQGMRTVLRKRRRHCHV